DPVVLETDLVGGAANYEALLQAWDELGPVSVDSLVAGQPPLLDFADSSCLYSAAVLWSCSSLVETESPVEQPTAAGISNPYMWDLQTLNVKVSPGGLCQNRSHEVCQARQTKRVWETVGALYISQSPIPRECYIGISILPDFRQKGLGRRACELAVQFAIEGLGVHRVQARIVSSPHSNRARSLFAALGFSHEGVHRRAVVGSAGEWADVMHMGVLDTTWAIRTHVQANAKSLWDEIFERHQREREDLLRFDERQGRLRKTSSMELV
ncbi:hypothetical protein BD413DRAFT_429946, partial [Trametes elegans]